MKALSVTLLACAVALVPSIARAQDPARKDIEAANRKFSEVFAKGNAADVAALYSTDAIAFPPNSEPVKGQAAIQKLWQDFMASGAKGVRLTTGEVVSHGNMAHEVGAFEVTDAAGKTIDRGNYIVIWEKAQGQWKLHRDIWNSAMPAK